MSYQPNPLLQSLPLALSKQLDLPIFLNDRRLVNSAGLVFCCDTEKGFITVQNLINEWGRSEVQQTKDNKKNILIVLMVGHFLFEYNRTDEEHSNTHTVIQRMCKERSDLKCVFLFSETVLSTLAPRYFSFVYTDVYKGYDSYIFTLRRLYSLLSPDGVLMGSRYSSNKRLSHPIIISHAVDDFFTIHVKVSSSLCSKFIYESEERK